MNGKGPPEAAQGIEMYEKQKSSHVYQEVSTPLKTNMTLENPHVR